MHARLLLPALALAGVAAAACTDGAAGVPGAAPIAAVVDALDGEHFGFLTAVSTEPATVTIDPAVWVDDDAEPNGFRIEDPGTAPVELAVADDATIEVFLSTGDPGTATTVTVAELAAWHAGLGASGEVPPFDVTVADGEVVELRFVYRP